MKTNLSLIPKSILTTAIASFVSCCQRFPGLRVDQNKDESPRLVEVPMYEVVDTTCDSLVELLEIPVFVKYADVTFDFGRMEPYVKGIVRVDTSTGKSWLVADFADLGKQRLEYDSSSAKGEAGQ